MLTVEERRSMSQWLVNAASPASTDRSLSQVEELCEQEADSSEFQVSRGPFGAFRGRHPGEPATPQTNTISPSFDSIRLLENDWQDLDGQCTDPPTSAGASGDTELNAEAELGLEPGLEAEADAEIAVDWEAFPAFETLSPNTLQMVEMAMGAPFPISFASPPDFGVVDPQLQDTSIGSAPLFENHSLQIAQVLDTQSQPYFGAIGSVSSNAFFLLKHYTTVCLHHLTPFKHGKTPWHIIILPLAKSCLAALTIDESMDHATLCIFYGILSISATSLGGMTGAKSWRDEATSYLRQACEHCTVMLYSAYDIPKPAKYKTILSALIVMAQSMILSGNREPTEYYLLEAEKFIRLRGLKRRKSRKVRLLHHCYGHMRIFYESTHVSAKESRHRSQVRKAVETSEVVAYNLDNLCFRLGRHGNIDEDMLKVKSRDQGENDLHLNSAGDYAATLYPEIFGLPEPWILMLSLSIRLGKEKDTALDGTGKDCLTLAEFSKQAEAVERWIGRLCSKGYTRDMFDNAHFSGWTHFENFLDATRYALEIYFYRRVHNVNTSLLQAKVLAVRDCLAYTIPVNSAPGQGCMTFLWPAFIAASEAQDENLRNDFRSWFKRLQQATGFQAEKTLASLEEVWERKQVTGHQFRM